MYIRDLMKTNVVTIPSSAVIADARKIMQAHNILRLPVVDNGKLVGILTNRKLDSVSPSGLSTLSVWELSYLLNKITVKEVMEKNVISVAPDTTVEEALALAQTHKVGAVVVVEDNRVVGISTTNDFFYGIINPVLGIGEGGYRIEVKSGGDSKNLETILHIVNQHDIPLLNIHVYKLPEASVRDAIIHLDCDDCSTVMAALQQQGFTIHVRNR